LPPIKVNHLIYLPMLDEVLTLEGIRDLPTLEFGSLAVTEQEERKEQEAVVGEDFRLEPLLNHKSDKYEPSMHVRVRLLSSKPGSVDFYKCPSTVIAEDKTSKIFKSRTYVAPIESAKSTITEMWKQVAQKAINVPNNLAERGIVVLHVHGGGFVAMSSSSHQNYTRVWANNLEIPVFSVDYRLSPDHRFPDALNDCWQVYVWLLEQGERRLGFPIKEIVLAGDSAGGNLIASLTTLCIKKNYKRPLSLVMSYPATYVSNKRFVPSLLLSLDDILLPSRFL